MMAALITGLICFLVIGYLEVPLPEVVSVVREIILAVAHTLLVVLVLRIILFVLFLGRRRRDPCRSSSDTETQSHHPNPYTLLQIHSHRTSISQCWCVAIMTFGWMKVCPVMNSLRMIFSPMSLAHEDPTSTEENHEVCKVIYLFTREQTRNPDACSIALGSFAFHQEQRKPGPGGSFMKPVDSGSSIGLDRLAKWNEVMCAISVSTQVAFAPVPCDQLREFDSGFSGNARDLPEDNMWLAIVGEMPDSKSD